MHLRTLLQAVLGSPYHRGSVSSAFATPSATAPSRYVRPPTSAWPSVIFCTTLIFPIRTQTLFRNPAQVAEAARSHPKLTHLRLRHHGRNAALGQHRRVRRDRTGLSQRAKAYSSLGRRWTAGVAYPGSVRGGGWTGRDEQPAAPLPREPGAGVVLRRHR